MAQKLEKTRLKLMYDDGVVNGVQKFRNKTYSNIQTEATAEGLFQAATALGSLGDRDVVHVYRIDESLVTDGVQG